MDLGFIRSILEKAEVQAAYQNNVLFYDPWSNQFFYMLTPRDEREIPNANRVVFKSIGHGQAVRTFTAERGTFYTYTRSDNRRIYVLSTFFMKLPDSDPSSSTGIMLFAMDNYPCYHQIE